MYRSLAKENFRKKIYCPERKNHRINIRKPTNLLFCDLKKDTVKQKLKNKGSNEHNMAMTDTF